MKPVLVVDRDRFGAAAALKLLDRCHIPALAVRSLEEAFRLMKDECDPPGAMLLNLATIGPVDRGTSLSLCALKTSRTVLLVGLTPPGSERESYPFLDTCVPKLASTNDYRSLLLGWCSEAEDRKTVAPRWEGPIRPSVDVSKPANDPGPVRF